MATVPTQGSGAPVQPGVQAAAQMGAAARRFPRQPHLRAEDQGHLRIHGRRADVLVLPAHQPPRPGPARHGRQPARAGLRPAGNGPDSPLLRTVPPDNRARGRSRPAGKRDGHDHLRARRGTVLLHHLRRTPGSDAPGQTRQDPWGWRIEGHHVSLHFSVWGDNVISVTPFFFGANPAEVRKGPKQGLRILGDREDLAFQLMESLDQGQQGTAIIYDEAPLDILTYNSTKVSFPFKPQGLAAAEMTGAQKETLLNLVALYVGQVRTDLAEQKLAAIREGGLDHFHLAWAGPVSKNDPHYYRIHGGNFVVEFDNRQDGANHIHSVWRDIENDFAADVLREHLRLFHIL